MRKLLNLGALIMAAQITVAVTGVISLRLITGLVSPTVFGGASLVLSALLLGQQLAVAGFTAAQLRFYSKADASGNGDGLTALTMQRSVLATLALVGLGLIAFLVTRHFREEFYGWPVAGASIVWLFSVTIRNVAMTRVQAESRQARYAMLQIAEALLTLIVTATILARVPTVAAYVLSQGLATVILIFVLLKRERSLMKALQSVISRRSTSGTSQEWNYALPFVPMSLLTWIANLGDRYAVAAIMGNAAAGRYVGPFSIASRPIILTNTALNDLFRPILFDAENRGDKYAAEVVFRRWLLAAAAFGVVISFTVYYAGDLIALLVLAPAYRDAAAAVMLWIVVGYLIFGINQILETRLLSVAHSKKILLPTLVGAASNILLSIILVKVNGVIGAAQATCASFAIQTGATWLVLGQTQRRSR